MKVIYTLFNSAAGKLAGIVAAHLPRGGNYIRERIIPKNPKTAEQARVRAILASLSAAWTGTLTTVQRDGWNALGGSGPIGTGQNLYTAGNAILLQAAGTRVDDAPTGSATATFTPPLESDIEISIGDTHVLVDGINSGDDWNLTAGGVLSVYISPRPQPEAHTANSVGLTYAGSITSTTEAIPGSLFRLPGGQTAQANQIWFVRIVTATADGKKSADATYRIRTAATAPRPLQILLDEGDFSFSIRWSRNIDTGSDAGANAFTYWGTVALLRHNSAEAPPASALIYNGTEDSTTAAPGTPLTMDAITGTGLTYNGGTDVPGFTGFPLISI